MSSNLSRRLLLQVGLGGAATALLAACAPPPAAQPTPAAGAAPTAAPAAAPAQAAAPLTAGAIIVRFHCREGDLSNHFVEYAKRYNAKNQKVNVKVEPMVATTEYWLKLSAFTAPRRSATRSSTSADSFRRWPTKGCTRTSRHSSRPTISI